MSVTGILPINKPVGISSFDVIRRIKRIMPPEWKKEKIGHGGTLDNLAGGVLPILFGEATKAFDFLLRSDKIYLAGIQMGAATDTDDSEGQIISRSERKASRAEIEALLPEFTGNISQIPPKYSALKVDGQRSYDLARANVEVEHKPRNVAVYELKIEGFDAEKQLLSLMVRCSSGTYIRSIARDIGSKIGCGGHIVELTRLKSAGITIDECVDMESLNSGNMKSRFIGLNGALDLPVLALISDPAYIRNGKPLNGELFMDSPAADGIYKVEKEGSLIAVVEKSGPQFKYLRVFNEA